MFWKIFASLLLLSLAAYAQQSLGDIARQYRDKQKAEEEAGRAPKLYTNQDIPPAEQVGTPEASDEERPAARPMSGVFVDRPAQQRFTEQHAAGEWRRNIVMQENRVAGLQMRISQLNAMIHSPYGTAQYGGPYNPYQARAQQRLAEMQMQLDVQRRKLDEMQDAARHAVMHSSVYDP
jgi:hypothetical protein